MPTTSVRDAGAVRPGDVVRIRVFAAVGYERGWLSGDRQVLPTWGEACTFSPGNLGRIQLDRVR